MAERLFARMHDCGAVVYVAKRGRRAADDDDDYGSEPEQTGPIVATCTAGVGDKVMKAVFYSMQEVVNYIGTPGAMKQFFEGSAKQCL